MMCRKAEKTAYGQFMQFDTLTMVPFDLDGVEPALMTEREKKLLNEYHRKVYETIGPQLPEEEREWLAYATREI
jgi:Xaa-Pro aminopeptidase